MKAAAASVVAAVVASACCIGPVALVLLGAGAFGGSLASLERYRPVFLTVTTGFLASRSTPPTGPSTIATSVNRRRDAATLKVAGMTCAGCEAAVKIAAKSVNGVTDVKASYDKKNAKVTYDPSKTTPEAIVTVITSKWDSRPKHRARTSNPCGAHSIWS